MDKKAILILSTVFLLYLTLSLTSKDILWDEAGYLSNSKFFLGKSNYHEAYRPLLISWMISGLWMITGESLLAVRLLMIFFSVVSVLLFYRISKIYFKEPSFPTILFAFSPLLVYWSFRVYTDIVSLALILIGFLCLKKDKNILSGLCLGLASIFRFSRLVFPSVILITLTTQKKLKKTGHFSLGTIAGLSPWLAYNWLEFGNPLHKMIFYFTSVQKWMAENPYPSFLPFLNFLILFNFLLIFGIKGLNSFRKKETDDKILVNYIIAFLAIYLLILKRTPTRYLLSILPFFILAIWEGLRKTDFEIIKPSNKRVVGVLILVSLLVPSHFIGKKFIQNQRCWGAVPRVANYLENKTKESDVIVTNIWTLVGYYTGLRVYPPWKNLSSFKEEEGADYYIERVWYKLDEKPEILELKKKFKGTCSVIGVYKIT